jgi:hypothetical protein
MARLHDPHTRRSIEARLQSLQPTAARQWGTMTSDQMLWHVNQFLTFALDEASTKPATNPLMLSILRFFTLYMPWPKGAPTNPKARATGSYDFAAERARCLALIDKFVARPVDGPWPVDPSFGRMSGRDQSRLQAKHLDHHLRQFGG